MKGYRIFLARDGEKALEIISDKADEIDLAILDIMIPKVDGRELCRHIRRHPVIDDIPVIFLTARDREKDEILGLEIGADDYIPKPASLNLVLAHVQSLLRRQPPKQIRWVRFGKVYVDHRAREAFVEEEKLDLTATEFELLMLFFENPKRVFTRQEILQHISDDDKFVFDRTVDVHIKNLRLKMGGQGDLIKTYRGMGYGMNKEQIRIS